MIRFAAFLLMIFMSVPGAGAVEVEMEPETEMEGKPEHCTGRDCDPAKLLCFNLLCSYDAESAQQGKYKSCESAARFQKWVTADGREIADTSAYPHNPEFEVQCDGQMIFNNSAYRYTDALGTRVQAQAGPYPATLLPKGALREGHRYVLSTLELNGQILRGQCYVYTGLYIE